MIDENVGDSLKEGETPMNLKNHLMSQSFLS
jgi:hypothetical protein